MIYLDANATTPLLPEVLDAMLPWLRRGLRESLGLVCGGQARPRRRSTTARAQVAGLIGAEPDEIVFTGGGTESVNTALRSLDRLAGPGAAVVSAIEHSAVLRCVENLARETRSVAVDAGGRLDLTAFAAALDGAALVSVMAANNETGVIQPLREAVELARQCGVPVHTDAIQAAGKIPLDGAANWAWICSPYPPTSSMVPRAWARFTCGAGCISNRCLRGGGQEAGRRSGTENTRGHRRHGRGGGLCAAASGRSGGRERGRAA